MGPDVAHGFQITDYTRRVRRLPVQNLRNPFGASRPVCFQLVVQPRGLVAFGERRVFVDVLQALCVRLPLQRFKPFRRTIRLALRLEELFRLGDLLRLQAEPSEAFFAGLRPCAAHFCDLREHRVRAQGVDPLVPVHRRPDGEGVLHCFAEVLRAIGESLFAEDVLQAARRAGVAREDTVRGEGEHVRNRRHERLREALASVAPSVAAEVQVLVHGGDSLLHGHHQSA